MEIGTIVYANAMKVYGFAGRTEERQYAPFSVDTREGNTIWRYINPIGGGILLVDWLSGNLYEYPEGPIGDELMFLDNSQPDGTTICPLFIGGETHPNERAQKVQFDKGEEIGLFTGKSQYIGSTNYYQVAVQLRGYTGDGDDFPVIGKVWFRENDITDTGLAQKKLTETGSSTNSPSKEIVTDSQSNSNSSQSSPNWLLVGGIFAGVLIVGGSFLYALRTPKTP